MLQIPNILNQLRVYVLNIT